MKRFVPYEKLSKKKKRERDAAHRGSWARSPVTRRPADPKVYDRRKARKELERESFPCFFFTAAAVRGK